MSNEFSIPYSTTRKSGVLVKHIAALTEMQDHLAFVVGVDIREFAIFSYFTSYVESVLSITKSNLSLLTLSPQCFHPLLNWRVCRKELCHMLPCFCSAKWIADEKVGCCIIRPLHRCLVSSNLLKS